jgi:hypothetical protein
MNNDGAAGPNNQLASNFGKKSNIVLLMIHKPNWPTANQQPKIDFSHSLIDH